MVKSNRYRGLAKLVLGIGLLLCALACAAYGILLIPAVKGIPFEWEYLALVGFALALFALISLILFCIAKCEEEKEMTNEEAVGACAVMEVEQNSCGEPIESLDCTESTQGKKLQIKVDKRILKTVVKVAVPVIVIGAVTLSVSSNIKNAKKAKRRKQFYHWLG